MSAEVVPLRPSNPLARLEAAYVALEQASTLDEVRHLRDLGEAAQVYARAARLGIAAQNTAASFKVRAERKAGELLAQSDGLGEHGGDRRSSRSVRLEDLDISKSQSSRWQKLATIPEDRFEAAIRTTVDDGWELTTASLLRLAPRTTPAAAPRRNRTDVAAQVEQILSHLSRAASAAGPLERRHFTSRTGEAGHWAASLSTHLQALQRLLDTLTEASQ